jgi:hypothetical protein
MVHGKLPRISERLVQQTVAQAKTARQQSNPEPVNNLRITADQSDERDSWPRRDGVKATVGITSHTEEVHGKVKENSCMLHGQQLRAAAPLMALRRIKARE